jgi:hypothetical protein
MLIVTAAIPGRGEATVVLILSAIYMALAGEASGRKMQNSSPPIRPT